MHLCPLANGMTLRSCRSYSHNSSMSNTVANARTGREHNGRWKTGSTSPCQPVTLPTAGRPTNTFSHGLLWPSESCTMVPRMEAQDCADTSLDCARNAAKSWVTQDTSHALKAYAAAAITWGNVDMA